MDIIMKRKQMNLIQNVLRKQCEWKIHWVFLLNNLQKEAKEKPTVMFFPGEYTHSLANGASLDLFAPVKRLEDDKYYRAFNIFDREI